MSNFEDSFFKHNSDISIDFSIKSDLKINEHVVIIESEKVYLHKSQLNTSNSEFEITFTVKEIGEQTVHINVSNSYQVNLEKTIYIYSTIDYDFISFTSITEARRMYFKFLYEENIIDKRDYNEIVFGIASDSDISEVISQEDLDESTNDSASKSSNSLHIYGYVDFQDCNLGLHKAENVEVSAYDVTSLGTLSLLGRDYTDSNGYYSLEFSNQTGWPEYGYDIVVVFKLKAEKYQVQDSFQVYEYSYGVYQDYDHSYMERNHRFEYLDSNGNASDFGVAINLFEAATAGFEYINSVDHDDIDDYGYLGIEYPSSYSTSWYMPGFSEIYMSYNIAGGHMWDILLHEFGHYIADSNDFTAFIAASHSMYDNQIVKFGSDTGRKLAWSEGWANYFSIAAQDISNLSSLMIPDVGDIYYCNYNMETISNSADLVGEGSEYIIASILIDIADSNNESYDLINLGHVNLFNHIEDFVENEKITVPDYKLLYFTDFYSSFEMGPSDIFFGPLLTYNMISSLQSSSPSLGYEPPTFSWTDQGSGGYNMNEDFELYIMDSSGSLLIQPITIYNNTSVTLNDLEWTSILSSGVTSIKWNIGSFQEINSNKDAGPYYGNVLTSAMPSQISLMEGLSLRGFIFTQGAYTWYKFTAPSSSCYTFYSTGYTDTYAEFFNGVVSSTTSTGCVYFDNDSGVNYNFSETISMFAGQTIYLRVRGDDWTETGSYRIEVYDEGGNIL